MIEVYKKEIPLAAWGLFCNFVESITNGSATNHYVRQGWKALYTVHSEGRAPDGTSQKELDVLRNRWN